MLELNKILQRLLTLTSTQQRIKRMTVFHLHEINFDEIYTVSPDLLETFPGTCKRKFLCLQMISFEFLITASISRTVSRGKHFVNMTRPGARDWPAANVLRPSSRTMTFTTIRHVNK